MKDKSYFNTIFEAKAVDDSRVIEYIVSKEVVDREGDLVKIKGIDTKDFKKNPVIMLSHRHSDLPIGKAINIRKSGDEMKMKVEFPEEGVYPLADTVYKLSKSKFINGTSLGIIPDYQTNEYPENKKLNGKVIRRIINKSELFEVSIVALPMNQLALATGKSLTKAVDEGIIDELELKELELKDTKIDEKDTKTNDKDEIISLKARIAEMELELKEFEMNAEIEDSIYNELYDEFCDEKKVDKSVVDELYNEFMEKANTDNKDYNILDEYL